MEDPAGPQQKVIVLLKMVSEYAFCFGDKEAVRLELSMKKISVILRLWDCVIMLLCDYENLWVRDSAEN